MSDLIYQNGQYYTRNGLPLAATYDVRGYGAVGDGVTDDTAAIQAAISAAALVAGETSQVRVDLGGNTYAISAPINLKDGIVLTYGTLIAIGGSWAATDPMVRFSNTAAPGDLIRSARVEHLFLECNHLCSGVKISNATACTCAYTSVHHQAAGGYGFQTATKATECMFNNCRAFEWLYGEAGEVDMTQRLSYGFDIGTADVQMDGCVAAYCLIPMRVQQDVYNGMVNNCHFYNGTSGTPVTGYCVIDYSGINWLFDQCYLDNGTTILRRTEVSITNSLFSKSATGGNNNAVELYPTSLGQTVLSLIITGNRVSSNYTSTKFVKPIQDAVTVYFSDVVNTVIADNKSTDPAITLPATRGGVVKSFVAADLTADKCITVDMNALGVMALNGIGTTRYNVTVEDKTASDTSRLTYSTSVIRASTSTPVFHYTGSVTVKLSASPAGNANLFISFDSSFR